MKSIGSQEAAAHEKSREIHPIVPRVRIGGASRCGSATVLKEHGVRHRQGRHIADEMEEKEWIEPAPILGLRSEVKEGTTHQMQDAENLLGGEEPVCDHADEERGDIAPKPVAA